MTHYWRLSLIYFCYFALLGALVPFWNLYLSDEGLSAAQIGVLTAILMGTKIISPYLIGRYADHSHNRMRVIHITNFMAMLAFGCIFLLRFFSDSLNANTPDSETLYFLALCCLVFFFSFFWNGVIAQYDAITLLSLGDQHQRYGRVRSWGSAGFIATVLLLGWVFEHLALQYLPLAMLIIFATIWLSSLSIPELHDDVVEEQAGDSAGLRAVLSQPSVIAMLGVCFLAQFSFGTYYTFFSLYLVDYGYSESEIGALWAVSVTAELLLFSAVGFFLRRFSVNSILIACLGLGALRWLLIGQFPDSPLLLAAAQLIHAANFALYHASAVDWVRRAFGNGYMGRGQAIYSAVSFGLGGASGALLAGLLWTDQASVWWTLSWSLSAIALLIAVAILLGLRRSAAQA